MSSAPLTTQRLIELLRTAGEVDLMTVGPVTEALRHTLRFPELIRQRIDPYVPGELMIEGGRSPRVLRLVAKKK